MIRLNACWFPGLFLLNDFTVPGAAISRGDGKNPATHRIIRPSLYQMPSRTCPPSSFGPRFRTVNSKTRFLGLLVATIRRSGSFHT